MWNKNNDGHWFDEYDQTKYIYGRRFALFFGLVTTLILVISNLAKGNDWQKTLTAAIVGVLITVGLWSFFSLQLIGLWIIGTLAKLIKKLFGIKEE